MSGNPRSNNTISASLAAMEASLRGRLRMTVRALLAEKLLRHLRRNPHLHPRQYHMPGADYAMQWSPQPQRLWPSLARPRGVRAAPATSTSGVNDSP